MTLTRRTPLKRKGLKRKLPKKENLAKEACRLAQLRARLAETDENGRGRCWSCGEFFEWGQLEGGHFEPKGRHYNGACLDPRNIHIQCSACNRFERYRSNYSANMIRRFGEAILETLFLLAKKFHDREYFQEAIPRLKEECREIAKTKNFEVRI
jgi:hypothetical protein